MLPDAPTQAEPERAATLVAPPGEAPRSAGIDAGAVRDALAGEEPRPKPLELRAPSDALRLTLIGSLVGPDRAALSVADVQAKLTALDDASAPAVTGRWRDTDAIHFEDLPARRYRLAVEAEGYRHLPQTFELDPARIENREPGGESVQSERVYLWPDGWIGIRVFTPDGRPFDAITKELGLEPRRFFASAFEAAASRAPIPDGIDVAAIRAEGAARFSPPKAYQEVAISDATVGALVLQTRDPLWVGLWVHGKLHAVQALPPDADALDFTLDLAALEERFGRVELRVVDEAGQPRADVACTLKSDYSAYRRADLSNVAPSDEGRVVFTRVVPQHYELTLEASDALLQRRLDVGTGERLDLGELVLRRGRTIPVIAVNAAGDEVEAAVRVGPYERAGVAGDLYPPNRHLWTHKGKPYLLPLPDVPSIVCVEPQGWSDNSSANFLLDPEHPPNEIRLVAREPQKVRFEPASPWRQGDCLRIYDELELVVASTCEQGSPLDARLFAGRLRVVRLDAEGREVGRVTVDLEPDATRLTAP